MISKKRFLDIHESNFGYPEIYFGYHKIKLINGYPKIEFWISKNRFLDIHNSGINGKTAPYKVMLYFLLRKENRYVKISLRLKMWKSGLF